jgi:predicted secreted protein
MEVVSGIVLYFIIWWVVFLLMLPIGYIPQDFVEKGHASSAPKTFNFKRKAFFTTVVSCFIFTLLYGLIVSNFFSFRDIVIQNPKW